MKNKVTEQGKFSINAVWKESVTEEEKALATEFVKGLFAELEGGALPDCIRGLAITRI